MKQGRPRKGKQATEVVSIRMEPKIKAFLKKKYGSIQKWADSFVKYDMAEFAMSAFTKKRWRKNDSKRRD